MRWGLIVDCGIFFSIPYYIYNELEKSSQSLSIQMQYVTLVLQNYTINHQS